MSRFFSYLFSLLFFFLLLELTLHVACKFAWINILMPNYSLNPHEDFLPEHHPEFGYIHKKNSSFIVKKNCLENVYHFNEYGFRETLAAKNGDSNRVIVIGDSFMEGVGVQEEERLSDLLEETRGIPHLNFAMADKGSTQAFSIYSNLAGKWNHSEVVWALFPSNDFNDDQPNLEPNSQPTRPTWVGNYPNYVLQKPSSEIPKEKSNKLWKRVLKSYTYTYDALFYLKESIKYQFENSSNNQSQSDYFNFTEEEWLRLKFSIEKMKVAAANKDLKIICIPSHLDLQKPKNDDNIEQLIAQVCSELDIEFIGLYSHFKEQSNSLEKYYLTCDSHWNAKGHQAVANILLNQSAKAELK